MSLEQEITKQYAQYKGVLKGAKEGEVVTRFPPEPSGYLHIGHIKASILNYHYSQIYKGQMLVRFDDTNPSKEKNEFVDSILEDIKTLGIKYTKLSYSSDYFDKAEEYCLQLLQEGKAYCDNTAQEKMREERGKGVESVNRNNTPEQNIEIWGKMKEGTAHDYCVRAKISMKALNKCMRDPVLYRHNDQHHHRTGDKYKVYPTYDFICPILDSIEGVTHAMRTNEYSDRIEQYHWVQSALGLRKVEIYEFSRLNFVNTCLSKRKLQAFVDTGRVEGWDDPRFPTLRGILRRGITVQTLTEFMLEQGPSKNSNLMEWDKLWAINARIIDKVCPRLTAIGKDKPALLKLLNGPEEVEIISVPQHQKNEALGQRPLLKSKSVYLEQEDAASIVKDEKITLMKWGNVQILDVVHTEHGIQLTGQYLPDDKDFKSTKKVNWLAENSSLVDVTLVEYDHLIKVKKIEEEMNFDEILNEVSKYETHCLGEPFLRQLKQGDFLQLERRGYFIVDKIVLENKEKKYILNFIPDGKIKGMSSIATKIDQETMTKGKQEIESKQKPKEESKKDKKKKADAEAAVAGEGQEHQEQKQEKKEKKVNQNQKEAEKKKDEKVQEVKKTD